MGKILMTWILTISLTSCSFLPNSMCIEGLERTSLTAKEKKAVKENIREAQIDVLVRNNRIIKRGCE